MEERLTTAYLRLCQSSGFGPALLARLLSHFTSLPALLAAAAGDAPIPAPILGLSPEQRQILDRVWDCREIDAAIAANLAWAEGDDCHLLCFESPAYPYLLQQIDSPPPLLYVQGDLAALDTACCALVGSRKASNYGQRHGEWLAHELAALGITVVSGLAVGIDSRAHRGALKAGGKTLAVMATGMDKIYPPTNRQLADAIQACGALVSEFPLGSQPRPHHFPRRNRIISGLSLGTVVVEGGLKSGSLITARLALEQNRHVFAVPGAIDSAQARGCHSLIKAGATLVEEADDIVMELLADWHFPATAGASQSHGSCAQHSPAQQGPAQQSPAQQSRAHEEVGQWRQSHRLVLAALSESHCLPESIAARTGIDLRRLHTILLELELAGAISMTGGRISRRSA